MMASGAVPNRVEVVSIAEARERDGLRMVSLAGVPSPWTEAAKGIFRVKGIDYVLAQRGEDEPQDAAAQWVGNVGVPAVVYNDERVRIGWAEILLLAERLAPAPALLPSDPEKRALALGLSHEVCGELGLGWSQRLVMIGVSLGLRDGEGFPRQIGEYLAPRYGWQDGFDEIGKARVLDILGMFSRRLDGHEYLMEDRLTAVDIYLATFVNLLRPLPPQQLPMVEMIRTAYTSTDPDIMAACDERIRAHQERIYERHLELPVRL
ncbi:MAG: hypothetical protein JJU22_11540 [Gammaproteobacteria bacterium]|nr:hypothetical protein [Gammaproteobacteria bacterium]